LSARYAGVNATGADHALSSFHAALVSPIVRHWRRLRHGCCGDVPVRLRSATDIVIPGDGPAGDAVEMRYFPAREGAPAHLESVLGDGNMDYNDGPNDVPGPDKKEWDEYVGAYQIDVWGKPAQQVTVSRKNGYLYFEKIRLVAELRPGLFFTSDGEAVDFTHGPPRWRNVRLRRIKS
jgi:hypothetical protein